jgi:hypothetical protein
MDRTRKKLRITNSELSSFRSCRQRWWFAYHELLRPRATPRPLSTGDCIHAGLAAAYRLALSRQETGGTASSDEYVASAMSGLDLKLKGYMLEAYELVGQATTADEVDRVIEESTAISTDARSSVSRFVQRFVAEDARQYSMVAVECPFTVRLRDAGGRARPRIAFSGVMDLVVYDPVVGDYVLVEHKSTAGDATAAESKLDMDPQTTGYVYALREMIASAGFSGRLTPQSAPVGRVLYNVVRKSPPSTPKVNLDGTVSVAAIDTTRDAYQAALDAQGEPEWYAKNPTKQAERWRELQEKQRMRLEGLPQSESRWLCRHETYHGAASVERWRREALAEAGLIRAGLRGDLAVTRNPSQCNMPWSPRCPYRSVCIEDGPEMRRELRVVSDPHAEVVEAELAQEESL